MNNTKRLEAGNAGIGYRSWPWLVCEGVEWKKLFICETYLVMNIVSIEILILLNMFHLELTPFSVNKTELFLQRI